jgi:tetratricopeptide (TPR) repeat protein
MSLIKRMFGRSSALDHRAAAERLFEAGDLGQAKLEYERALDKTEDGSTERAELAARIDTCCDAIADARVARAHEYLANGERDLAREELEGAIDTAASDEARKRAEAVLYTLERKEAVQAAEVVEVSDEDRLAAVAGSWEEGQDEEYAEYGDPMTEALLALYGGRTEEAREKLEALLESVDGPRYLWLEVARARLVTEDTEGGEKALRTFLEVLDDDEGGEQRLAAHVELARLADARGDVDGAVGELEEAAAFLDEDHRPLLELGRYLRSKERSEEALEVLEMAANLLSELRPDVRVLQELGLAHNDLGQDDDAVRVLESVISILTARQHLDFPPLTAVTLAKLHEKAGRIERAADLYAALTRGEDRENHLGYHLEAGRLLTEMGLPKEARRMFERASALAPDEETKALIRGRIEGEAE